jgi:transcription elongation factor GreA
MGKKRVQSRGARQVRQVRPKNIPVPAAGGDQRKQRERYVQSGGMLQGYPPELVVRIGYIAGAAALACVLVMVLLVLFLPYGWLMKGVAAAVWVVPMAFGLSFVLPGFQLARKDRTAEPRLVQGQLLGASEASTSLGLGMLMIKTRGGVEQYLVTPDKLTKVPGNQVNVMLTVTPNLRHVRGVGVMGQRVVGRPEQPVPKVLERLRLMPIVTPAALARGGHHRGRRRRLRADPAGAGARARGRRGRGRAGRRGVRRLPPAAAPSVRGGAVPHARRCAMTQSQDIPITAEGLAQVRQELDQLVGVRRPEIIAKIKAAREHGDLSENFEYHAARNEQSFIETRIRELEGIVKNHVIIETRASNGRVDLLSTVTFAEEGEDEETYRIVGSTEADPSAGRISYESAIGKALMGRRVGDEVQVQTPTGSQYTIRILRIE